MQQIYKDTLITTRKAQRWRTLQCDLPNVSVRGMRYYLLGTVPISDLQRARLASHRVAVRCACWTMETKQMLAFVSEPGALPEELGWGLETPAGSGIADLSDVEWARLLSSPDPGVRLNVMRLCARSRGSEPEDQDGDSGALESARVIQGNVG